MCKRPSGCDSDLVAKGGEILSIEARIGVAHGDQQVARVEPAGRDQLALHTRGPPRPDWTICL